MYGKLVDGVLKYTSTSKLVLKGKTSSNSCNMIIWDFKMYDKVLSADEISAL